MFVIESIQPKSKQSKNIFELTYPFLTRLIGVGLFLMTVLYITIAVEYKTLSVLVLLSIFFMLIVGIYYGFRSVSILVNGDNKTVNISKSFFLYQYFYVSLSFSEIINISYENRWMGQTFQPKYRIFIHTRKKIYDIGTVNQGMKINYILKKIWEIIDPEKLKELSPEKE
jgi:hypothetical protein